MSRDQWTAVDDYFTAILQTPDPVLDATLDAMDAAGLPAINVSPVQGKLLQLLARIMNARRILEIGTLGGYSTIWLARALPEDGHLITLEAEPKHADVARVNIDRAGLESMVEVRVGLALDLLPKIAAEQPEPFDLIFIDANKSQTPDYFTWALKLSRRGSLIIVDNVVRNGTIADPAIHNPDADGIRRFFQLAAAEPRVDLTALQTVGSKGYDGFALALVTEA